ncbi:MAG TPA: hypothetical protein VFC19_32005 [Candidatus Limnocylindrales bacterium]|nr:hypothetical protein [Candidatus Limnocylindrales bacterium]
MRASSTGILTPRAEPDIGAPDNGAGFVDAACVSYYRTIRRDVPATAAQIGYGVNKMPPSDVVTRWLVGLHADLFRDRVTDYSGPDDVRDRTLVAELAGAYLGVTGLGPDNVAFCNGTTEAISITLGFAARHGMRAVLPLPLYCSFEQSAIRHGVPVVGYYNARGEMMPLAGDADPLLFVDIAPNGVTGSWFTLPASTLDTPALRIVDHVFALPTFQAPQAFLATLRGRVGDLSRTAVFLTPSKDLSIPGLRCGTILTAHPGLVAYMAADRFERGYTTQVGLGRIAAAHLSLLLQAFAVPGAQEAFSLAGLRFPEEHLGFLAHLAAMRRRFTDNLNTLDDTDFLGPLDGVTYAAGYSGFQRLDRYFPSATAYTAWIHAAGRAGLKLNPNLLFGADPRMWAELYPHGHGIRVNVSVPPEQLAANLETLRRLLP